jgi:hypothetical protein
MPDRAWQGAWHERITDASRQGEPGSGVFVDVRVPAIAVVGVRLWLLPGAGVRFVFPRFPMWQRLCPRPDVRAGGQMADAVE